jgi:hypothetical protein
MMPPRIASRILLLTVFAAAGCRGAADPGAVTGTFPGGNPAAVMQNSTNPYSSGNAPPQWGGPAGGGGGIN